MVQVLKYGSVARFVGTKNIKNRRCESPGTLRSPPRINWHVFEKINFKIRFNVFTKKIDLAVRFNTFAKHNINSVRPSHEEDRRERLRFVYRFSYVLVTILCMYCTSVPDAPRRQVAGGRL